MSPPQCTLGPGLSEVPQQFRCIYSGSFRAEFPKDTPLRKRFLYLFESYLSV